MKRLVSLVVAVAFVAGFSGETTKKVTVTGTLIDTKCYGMNHDNVANEHYVGKDKMKMPNCATACANMGIPAGLLKDGKKDGEVYILVTPANAVADHMAKEARVTGEMAYAGGIIPSKIEVKNDKGKWEEVKVTTMM